MEYVNESYEEMKCKVVQLEQEKERNAETINNLEKQLQDLQFKSRSAAIELRNVPYKNEEKMEDLLNILSAFGRTMAVTIERADLRDLYRLPGKTGSVRPIVAEFSSVSKRSEFLSAARLYNKDRPKEEKLNTRSIGLPGDKKPVYVDDHLTPTVKKLLYDTRQWAQPFNFIAWASNGNVYLKKTSKDKPVHVKSTKCLALLTKKQ